MEKRPFIFHSDQDDFTGIRVTVVGDYTDGVLKVAASRCSPEDHFARKIGRDIALDRLNKDKLITSIETGDMSNNKFISIANAVADSVIENGIEQKIELIEISEFGYKLV